MDLDRCYRFRLHVPEDRLEASYESSDGSSIDTSFSEDSCEGRMSFKKMNHESRLRLSLRDYSPERYESSSEDSNSDDSDIDNSREICTFREDVLPGAEHKLLHLSNRHQNIEHHKLDQLLELVKFVQDEMDCHWKFPEDLEVEVYDESHRCLQESMDAVKDDVTKEKFYQTGLCYKLCQAQKQNQMFRHDQDRYRKKIRNLEYELQRVEYESARKINIARKRFEEETTELRSEMDELRQDLWHEKEKGKKNVSQNNKFQTEKDRHRHENQQLRANLKRAQSNLHKKAKQSETLKQELKRKADENAGLKDTIDKLKKQLSNETFELKCKVQQLLKKEKCLPKSIKHTRDSGQKHIPNDSIMLKRTNAEMKRQIEQMQCEMRNQNEEILKNKEMKKKYINVQILLKEEETAVINAKEIQRQLSKENSELKIKVQQLVEENSNLTEDLKHEKDAKKNQNSNKNSTLREKNYELQDKINKLHLTIKSLRNDLMQEKTNAEEINKEYKNMHEKLKKTNEEKESIITSTEDIQTQLRKKISELENNIEKLQKKHKNTKEDFTQNDRSEKDFYENSNLQQKNCKLQKEVEEMLHENQILKEKINSERDNFKRKENELQNEFRQILKEKESFTEDLKSAKEMVMKDDVCKNQNFQEIFKTFQKDVDELQLQNRRLNDALKQEKENVRKAGKEHSREKSELLETIERQQQDILTLKAKLVEYEARTSKVNERVNAKLDPEQDLRKRLADTLDQLKQTRTELDDTKSRLSRAMGDKLTDNNPNIADLSDKNRPTKISERYQELYDNQWTDAFEIVNGACMNEENTINILKIILKDTLEFCQAQAANQMIQIKSSFLKGEELPANMVKQVKDCRKAIAEQYGKQLYQEYWAHLSESKSEKASHAMRAQSYVKECFEICWLMTVQDPPVVFGADIHRNDVFNKDHYKAYTRSGDRVEYVVWPVLLLHQNGPVLCKGVAQGK